MFQANLYKLFQKKSSGMLKAEYIDYLCYT